jgi:hypothetical protein
MSRLMTVMTRIAEEPPFRLLARAVVKRLKTSVRTRAHWDVAERPQYLVGMLGAADQALRQGARTIAAIEFGVAGGNGLIALERYAAAVEAGTGVEIRVYGFDTGSGLPAGCGDYRDHPDQWRLGDYAMDEQGLRSRLSHRTELIIGNVDQTVPAFMRDDGRPPIGFVSIDVDLYSSAVAALRILTGPRRRILHRVAMYFDDVDFVFNHRFAGELLAIDEFNGSQSDVKIDVWRGLRKGRPFPEAPWLDRMYIAHDLEAISRVSLQRPPGALPLEELAPVG